MSTYFTSDLHFGHKSLCENIRHMTVEESDQLIIKNWNKLIKKQDLVYILGDVTMETPKLIEKYISQLKGTIYVIGGNHDTKQCCQELNRLGIPVLGCSDYKGYILSHIPVMEKEVQYSLFNIHGHIHKKNENDPYINDKYYNVCCEFHNYTPVSLDEIRNTYTEQGEKTFIKNLNIDP